MPRLSFQQLGLLSGLVAIVLAIGIALLNRTPETRTFTASDVQVAVGLTRDSTTGALTLSARYMPTRAGFHVYSKDLPLHGLDGLGRPTRLDPLSGLTASGDLVADQPVIMQSIDGLTEIFPVYPDGAITLRLPVTATGSGLASVKVSYMACSSTFGCLAPTEQIVTLAVP